MTDVIWVATSYGLWAVGIAVMGSWVALEILWERQEMQNGRRTELGPAKMVVAGVEFMRAEPGVYRASTVTGDRGACLKTIKSLPNGHWSAELRYADGCTFNGSGRTREIAYRKAALAAWRK